MTRPIVRRLLISIPVLWMIAFVAAMISITVLATIFVGDGMRDALDPRMGAG